MRTAQDIQALHNANFAPISGLELPHTLLHPSKTNPRKRFDETKLAELASSVKAHGVIQPILARPCPDWRDGCGAPPYEIVAGERRWRAVQMSGLDTLPVLLRPLSNMEVLQIQIAENIDRADLHPLEEAEGLQAMLRSDSNPQGYANADALAQWLGKSPRWLYGRLALLNLCAAAREAFLGDQINASVAGLLARMTNPEQQATATAKVLEGFGGEPYSFRAAAEYLRKTFMLKLSNASFDLTATYPHAGPCADCPKRSGANPDLFAELSGADHCQDATCFEAKTDAAIEHQLTSARAKGQTVLEGDAARRLMPSHRVLPSGYQWLDKPCPTYTDSKRPLREVMADNTAVVVLDHPGCDTPIAIAPDAAVKLALKAKGKLRDGADAEPETALAPPTPEAPSNAPGGQILWPMPTRADAPPKAEEQEQPRHHLRSDAQLQAAAQRTAGAFFSLALHERLRTEAGCLSCAHTLPALIRLAIQNMALGVSLSAEGAKFLYTAMDWQVPPDDDYATDLEARIADINLSALAPIMTAVLTSEELSNCFTLEQLHDLGNSGALHLARRWAVDMAALKDHQALCTETATIAVQTDENKRRAALGLDPITAMLNGGA